MKKPESAVRPGSALVAPVVCGLIVTFALMLLGALAVSAGRLSADAIAYASMGCIAAGGLLCGLLASRRAPHQRLVWGMIAGVILLVILLLVSLAIVGAPPRLPRVLLSAAAVLLPSCVGAAAGAGMKQKRNRKK